MQSVQERLELKELIKEAVREVLKEEGLIKKNESKQK